MDVEELKVKKQERCRVGGQVEPVESWQLQLRVTARSPTSRPLDLQNHGCQQPARTLAKMAENGTPVPNGDVEMQEPGATEVNPLSPTIFRSNQKLTLPPQARTDQQPDQPDPTDPQPAPRTSPSPPPAPATTTTTAQSGAEHLSTIQPHQPPPASTTPSAPPTTSTSTIPPLPGKPVPHGGPTRQYLNQNITPHLLEGMKYVAAYEPEKPLQWLSEFLAERSKEVEGGS